MADISAIFFILLIIGVAFPAMLAAWWLLFPNLIKRAQTRVEKSLGATFWLGVVVTIALIIPITILMALPIGPANRRILLRRRSRSRPLARLASPRTSANG